MKRDGAMSQILEAWPEGFISLAVYKYSIVIFDFTSNAFFKFLITSERLTRKKNKDKEKKRKKRPNLQKTFSK